MLKIEFKTDTAAFEDNPQEETLRILRKIIRKLEEGQEDGICMDINGNRIGAWFYAPPESEEE